MDNAISFAITYLPDSDLSVGYRYPSYIQLDPDVLRETLFFIKLILLFHGTVLSTALLTVLPRVNVEFRQHNFSKTKGKNVCSPTNNLISYIGSYISCSGIRTLCCEGHPGKQLYVKIVLRILLYALCNNSI